MKKQGIILKHEFVEFIPGELKEDTIYVSMRFGTASHLCVCGCGNKIVTPLRPTDWKLIFDGKTISLHPSIGNWSFPCRSHYWIRNNRVQWAEQWSQEEIDAGRAYDRRAKERYFGTANTAVGNIIMNKLMKSRRSYWQKLREWWSRRRGLSRKAP
jgi:hypothetical protein